MSCPPTQFSQLFRSSLVRDRSPDHRALLHTIGRPEILESPTIGLFCSADAPPDLYLTAFELIAGLSEGGFTVVSGFHSTLERDCLDILLLAGGRAIFCPPRSVVQMTLSRSMEEWVERDQLVLVSAADMTTGRADDAAAKSRNDLVLRLSDQLFIPFCSPGGKVIRLAADFLSRRRAVHCLDHPDNRDLILLGATVAAGVVDLLDRQPESSDDHPGSSD